MILFRAAYMRRGNSRHQKVRDEVDCAARPVLHNVTGEVHDELQVLLVAT